MKITKISDPYILNCKAELVGLRESIKYRNKLQYFYKREFTKAQCNGGIGAGQLAAMIQWNAIYINKLLTNIQTLKTRLEYLYESERKLLYMGQRGEVTDK